MQYFKSLIDAIGNGSGASLPLFNILLSVATIFTTSIYATVLLSAAIATFSIVAIPTFILMIKNARQEVQQKKEKLEGLEQATFENYVAYIHQSLINYRLNCARNLKNLSFEDYFEILLKNQFSNIKQQNIPQALLIELISNSREEIKKYYNIFVKESSSTLDITRLEHLKTDLISPSQNQLKLLRNVYATKTQYSASSISKATFLGFTLGFGVIGGTGAATAGLLTGVGLFAGISAVPIVGWAILATALVIGLTLATVSIIQSLNNSKIDKQLERAKALNKIIESNTQYLKTKNAQINNPNYKDRLAIGIRKRDIKKGLEVKSKLRNDNNITLNINGTLFQAKRNVVNNKNLSVLSKQVSCSRNSFTKI